MPNSRLARSALELSFAAVGLGFPFLVYFGLQIVPPLTLSAVLFALVGVRLLLDRSGVYRMFMAAYGLAAAGLITLALLSPMSALKSYPVLISFGLAVLFGRSLYQPPTVVERIARLRSAGDLPASEGYFRAVTSIWLVFFIFNGTVSTWTAFNDSLELWTLYNGLISYLLIGSIFASEFFVRSLVRRRQRVVP